MIRKSRRIDFHNKTNAFKFIVIYSLFVWEANNILNDEVNSIVGIGFEWVIILWKIIEQNIFHFQLHNCIIYLLITNNFTVTFSNVNEDRWSGCWTEFPTPDTICRSEFGDSYEGYGEQNCGFLDFGKRVLCRENCK